MKRLLLMTCLLAALSACAGPGSRPLGAACTEKEQCRSGLCLQAEQWGQSTGWPGGYCTKSCSGGCGGGVCASLGGQSFCLAGCAASSDCRTGYVCDPTLKGCLPDCRRGWDCGSALVCGANGSCVTPPTHNLGDPCALNADCKSDYCVPQQKTATGLAWKDGMCSQTCGSCPANFNCLPLGGVALCLPDCAGPGSCRDGYLCNPVLRVCLPDCRLGWDCGNGLTCDPNGFCS